MILTNYMSTMAAFEERNVIDLGETNSLANREAIGIGMRNDDHVERRYLDARRYHKAKKRTMGKMVGGRRGEPWWDPG
jgi:hypothetical protein